MTHTHKYASVSCRDESFTRGKSCLMNNAVIYDQQNCRNPYNTSVRMSLVPLLICRDKSEVCVESRHHYLLIGGKKNTASHTATVTEMKRQNQAV